VDNLAGRLKFAASPIFALMAGVSVLSSPGMPICSAASFVFPVNEMALMYLLMSLFHLSPWLRFRSHRRAAARHHPN